MFRYIIFWYKIHILQCVFSCDFSPAHEGEDDGTRQMIQRNLKTYDLMEYENKLFSLLFLKND